MMSQAEILIRLAEKAELWHAPDATAYATVPVGDHRETHAVRRTRFRQLLVREFYQDQGKPPAREALQSVLELLEARARYDGPEETAWIRTAEYESAIYLDLCDDSWRAVEITYFGWRVVRDPPVRFRRAPGMRPLPEPQAGGSIDLLREFVNVESQDDYLLLVACLIAALRPRGPYPVLGLQGEQGSAKSTTARVFRGSVDPSSAPLRAMPREERDLHIAANNGWVIAFDNVSRLQPWVSDALCRLATGAGFSTRELYSNQDEIIFDAMRPIILNGIEDQAERDDLRDRAVILTLPPIDDKHRRDEDSFWMEFGEARPRILGALLRGLSSALLRWPMIDLERKPRMADFARWVTAAEQGLGWSQGTFLAAYQDNRQASVEAFFDGADFAAAIRDLIDHQGEFIGTAGELLHALNERNGDRAERPVTWPKSARGASGQVRRAAPALRGVGIEVLFPQRRQIQLRKRQDRIVPTVTTVTVPPDADGEDDGHDRHDGSMPAFSSGEDDYEREAIQFEEPST